MRVVGIVASFVPLGAGTRGKFFVSSPRGAGNEPRRRVPGAPSSGTPRKDQANFRVGTVWGLGKGPVGTRPVESAFGKNSFRQETLSRRRGWSVVSVFGEHIKKHGLQDEGELSPCC